MKSSLISSTREHCCEVWLLWFFFPFQICSGVVTSLCFLRCHPLFCLKQLSWHNQCSDFMSPSPFFYDNFFVSSNSLTFGLWYELIQALVPNPLLMHCVSQWFNQEVIGTTPLTTGKSPRSYPSDSVTSLLIMKTCVTSSAKNNINVNILNWTILTQGIDTYFSISTPSECLETR